mmetsp:Transcript_50654/g.126105  ORF Transcript_50654/g.126105 Transcript_50654/m.126105 type:complete len:149 (-) Transcript_50654:1230-1676(-)
MPHLHGRHEVPDAARPESPVETFRIEFDRQPPVYFATEMVSGTLVLKTRAPVECQELRVCAIGQAKCAFVRKDTRNEVPAFYLEEGTRTYFAQSRHLFGSVSSTTTSPSQSLPGCSSKVNYDFVNPSWGEALLTIDRSKVLILQVVQV